MLKGATFHATFHAQQRMCNCVNDLNFASHAGVDHSSHACAPAMMTVLTCLIITISQPGGFPSDTLKWAVELPGCVSDNFVRLTVSEAAVICIICPVPRHDECLDRIQK